MRALGLLMVVVLALLVVAAPGSACSLSNGSVGCENGCVKITWSVHAGSGCVFTGYTIERKCGQGGTYVVIANTMNGSPYYDCPPYPGSCANWYYRVTVHCTGCIDEPNDDSFEVGPISCP